MHAAVIGLFLIILINVKEVASTPLPPPTPLCRRELIRAQAQVCPYKRPGTPPTPRTWLACLPAPSARASVSRPPSPRALTSQGQPATHRVRPEHHLALWRRYYTTTFTLRTAYRPIGTRAGAGRRAGVRTPLTIGQCRATCPTPLPSMRFSQVAVLPTVGEPVRGNILIRPTVHFQLICIWVIFQDNFESLTPIT